MYAMKPYNAAILFHAVSWVNDHYRARIEEIYREKAREELTVVVE
jgi:hypothetical protein